MEEIIVYKGGRSNGWVDGEMTVTREESGNVFIEVPQVNNSPMILRLSPEISAKLGEVLVRMGKHHDD